MTRAKPLRIGELSRRTGCSIETIRYYERIGLLPRPERHGSYRQYDDAAVSTLAFIRRARQLGFSLAEVGTLRRLATTGAAACAEARALAATHLHDVRDRIADLTSIERALAAAVGRCDAGEPSACPFIDSLAGPPTPASSSGRDAGM
jgi:MerR family mercuric resistance operon transcriptional regulator